MTEDIDFERWYRELYYKFTIIRDHLEDLNLANHPPLISVLLKLRETVKPNSQYNCEQKERQCREVSHYINQEFDRVFR